jgi:NHL repeat
MFVFPHGTAVDKDGNVCVAVADGKNGKGHVVVKFSPEGKVLMVLGKPGMPGDAPGYFYRPSAVAVAPDGTIFVADGHGGDSNARVVKIGSDGTVIKSWGKKGSAPGEFNEPHGIALDSAGRVFVADRVNSRIRIFDPEGKFLAEWKQFGRPSAVFIDKNDMIYAPTHRPRTRRAAPPIPAAAAAFGSAMPRAGRSNISSRAPTPRRMRPAAKVWRRMRPAMSSAPKMSARGEPMAAFQSSRPR